LAGTPLFECPAHSCWTCAYTKQEDAIETDAKVNNPRKKRSHASGAVDTKRGELFVS
jgi:hypothetical protein